MRVKYLYLDAADVAADCRADGATFAGPTPLACVLSSVGFVVLSVGMALFFGR